MTYVEALNKARLRQWRGFIERVFGNELVEFLDVDEEDWITLAGVRVSYFQDPFSPQGALQRVWVCKDCGVTVFGKPRNNTNQLLDLKDEVAPGCYACAPRVVLVNQQSDGPLARLRNWLSQ